MDDLIKSLKGTTHSLVVFRPQDVFTERAITSAFTLGIMWNNDTEDIRYYTASTFTECATLYNKDVSDSADEEYQRNIEMQLDAEGSDQAEKEAYEANL